MQEKYIINLYKISYKHRGNKFSLISVETKTYIEKIKKLLKKIMKLYILSFY